MFGPILLSSLLTTLPKLVSAVTSKNNTGDLAQGYLFGFTTSALPLPIVNSCPSPLTVSTATSLAYGGNDPQGPYYMMFMVREQLLDDSGDLYEKFYTHTEVLPDMNNVRTIGNPLMNGTQFIACVTSANGVSGGCQDLITVVPSVDQTLAAYANDSSICRSSTVRERWVTPLNRTLQVDLISSTGLSSLVGWPATCTDVMFVPKNGTPPYTTVIAPAQHPPVNISSTGSGAADNSMNYTIRLTHGQAFMAAVFDSAGNSWAAGPLHAGASNDLSCLAVATGQTLSAGSSGGVSVGALAGGIVGALVVGGVLAFLVFYFLDKKRKRHHAANMSRDTLDLYADPRLSDKSHPPITPFSETGSSAQHQLGYANQPLLNTSVPQGEGSAPSPVSANGAIGISPESANESYGQLSPGFGTMRSAQMDRSSTVRSTGSHLQPNHSGPGSLALQTTYSRHSTPAPGPSGPPDSAGTIGTFNSDSSGAAAAAAALAARNVYVVHSDGGAHGDYHIQLPAGGANVIELPPGYSPSGDERAGSSSRRRRPDTGDSTQSPGPATGTGTGTGSGIRTSLLRARNGSFDGDRTRVIGEAGAVVEENPIQGEEGENEESPISPYTRERQRDTLAQSEKARLIASMGRPPQ